jgi:hypothetical protein
LATASQYTQLPLQRIEFSNALLHLHNALIEQLIDFLAAFSWGIAQTQQQPDVVERHIKRSTMADKLQPLDVSSFITGSFALRAGAGKSPSCS